MKARVLIIDDEDKLRSLLNRIISLEGYEVMEAANIGDARKMLDKEEVDIALCDVKLPDGNGVAFTKEIKEKHLATEIILLTAYGNIPDGIQAMKNGAFDYIVKGDDNDKIVPLLNRACEKVQLQRKVLQLQKQLNKKYGFDSILGESPVLLDAVTLASKVAPTDASVLLTGETGTGKEVFAQAIHYASERNSNPFVALNCSAFGKELIESELFGHKAGAFTGANKDKKGLIEEANGGTLFLDEIGEMPLELQPKLLRFLENGTYYRVGDSVQRKADVRLIAATNRDLQKEINTANFRSDLYYRIAVFMIHIPPLRERQKDIALLAKHYLNKFAAATQKQINTISTEALQALQAHSWPGNVRELKNVIERAAILEDSSKLSVSSLPQEIQEPPNAENSNLHLSAIEKLHIQKVLKSTGGNKTETARLLDIGIATLYRKIEEYGLK